MITNEGSIQFGVTFIGAGESPDVEAFLAAATAFGFTNLLVEDAGAGMVVLIGDQAVDTAAAGFVDSLLADSCATATAGAFKFDAEMY